jgi:phosphoribosyl 1,2-cyclic phosphate phosphodiesterase
MAAATLDKPTPKRETAILRISFSRPELHALPRQPISRDFRGQMILLGTGTSHGVPVVGCGCAVCQSDNPHNKRTRCSAVLGLPEGNLLIDTTPELRLQLLREQIGLIHAVTFTHGHADHMFGLDDLRIMADYLGQDVPIYCTAHVEHRIREAFAYAFDPRIDKNHAGGVPRLVFRRIDEGPFQVLGAELLPIALRHGHAHVNGYRCGRVAYCTDTNAVPPESMARLSGLDVLVLDCLRPRPHATHFHVDEAVATARQIGARQTYFTHLCHDLEHDSFRAQLPPSMAPAYDGLVVPLSHD